MKVLLYVTSMLYVLRDVNAEICTSSVCSYDLDIRWARSMTHRTQGAAYNVALNGDKLQIVKNSYRRNDPNIGMEVDQSEVHTTDGYPRNIIEINGQFPGPAIEVMEGSEIVVIVHNNLDQQSVSIHWHGIHQRGSPWMDGVPYVTQCPISPRHSYVYRFKASPAGTHWYHSHMVSQRLDGLYGMLIVHKNTPEVPTLPLMVTDWYHVDATTLTVMNPFDIHYPGTGEFDMTDLNAKHHLRFEDGETKMTAERTTGSDGHYHSKRNHEKKIEDFKRSKRDTGEDHSTMSMNMTGSHMGNMATEDPHAGHNMGNVSTQGTHAGDNMGNMPTQDPHAGHNMGNMATQDPHAGHNMGNMATQDPHAVHNMGNMATQDPDAGHNIGNGHHMDDSDHGGHGNHNLFSPYGPTFDDMYVISGLINGKGRYGGNKAPLTIFEVIKGKRYRIRVVNAGAHLAMRVSLDRHKLSIVELDGNAVQALEVDSAVVFPGERLDVEFVADQRDDNFWLRVDGVHGGHSIPSEAIVRYSTANKNLEPTSHPRVCSMNNRCIHFNCPDGNFPAAQHIQCISVDKLQSVMAPDHTIMTQDPDEVMEYFLNLGFNYGPSFNGYKYKPPSMPLYQGDDGIFPCNTKECDNGGCECTYTIDVPFNRTVQLVLTNYDISEEGTTIGHHSTHVHGHSFYVLKLGYPKWDRNSGILTGPNDDINCGDPLCRSASWRSRPKDLNLVDPVLKDTVIVPSLGYAVVRFRSDNPGMWLIHCHVDPHSNGGMTVLVKEAEDAIGAPPTGYPRCGNYGDGADMSQWVSQTEETNSVQPHSNQILLERKSLIAIILGSVSLGAILIIITVAIGRRFIITTRNKNGTV